MGGGDDFFDDFRAAPRQEEEELFSEEDFQRVRSLFLEGHPTGELRVRYRALLEEILGARGRSVEVRECDAVCCVCSVRSVCVCVVW